MTAGEEQRISAHGRLLAAGAAPQHVTFLDGRAFVTSGNDGTLQVYDERARACCTRRASRSARTTCSSAAGRVLTPSLNAGTLCVLDANGSLRERVRVASSSHDACLAPA